MELSRKQKRLFLGGVGKDHGEETIKDEVRRKCSITGKFRKIMILIKFYSARPERPETSGLKTELFR